MAARKRLFEAVFPPPTQKSLPTPTATPILGQGSFGPSFGTPAQSQDDSVSESIRFERAWHHATELLAIKNVPLAPKDALQDTDAIRDKWVKRPSQTALDAIAYVLSHKIRSTGKDDDLLHWYSQEVGRHYLDLQLPGLFDLLSPSRGLESLYALLRTLAGIHHVYVFPFEHYVYPRLPQDQAHMELERFRDILHAMIRTSLSRTNYRQLSKKFLTEWSSIVLGINRDAKDEHEDEDAMSRDGDAGQSIHQTSPDEARRKIANLLVLMDEHGLGGLEAQKDFAEVVNELMAAYVKKNYARRWASPSAAPTELRDWIQGDFASFVIENVSHLSGGRLEDETPLTNITFQDISNWQDRIINDLGTLRLKELFNVVVDWESNSLGAIEDLKQYTTSTSSRSHLVLYFAQVISQRLLHPGASTTQILQTYIYIIRAFAVLDPRGVLLDRLARPIRRYLRERDDTVNIIVTGLLADPDPDSFTNPPDTLIELALELNKISDDPTNHDESLADLDFDDLNWSPDPVDAGPDYRKSKSTDVISTLTSLFDSKEVFVKEFQSVLSTRLLDPGCALEKEERVLELLKLRFGEGMLQACEVMMRDVVDSMRTDAWVKREQRMEAKSTGPGTELGIGMHVSAKILSRLYWPEMSEESFKLPPQLQILQERYAEGFSRFKSTRKLTFLDALGVVDVELFLEDRRINERVPAAHASVIYTFQDEAPPSSGRGTQGQEVVTPVTKTQSQLAEELQMDNTLLEASLNFWVSKLVLAKSISPQTQEATYTVLETLPGISGTDPILPSTTSSNTTTNPSTLAIASAAATAASAPSLTTSEDLTDARLAPFYPFIVGMLTNQGSMPVGRIVGMLQMVVPGGFPFGGEELRGFLGRKVEGGELGVEGGKFGVRKKT